MSEHITIDRTREVLELSSLYYHITEEGYMLFTMVNSDGIIHQDIYRPETMNDMVRYWLNSTLSTDHSFINKAL